MSEIRICRVCGTAKELLPVNFRPHFLGHGGYRWNCRECEKAYMRKRYAENPEAPAEAVKKWCRENREQHNATKRAWYAKNKAKQKSTVLKRTYGISLDDYNQMLTKQNGGCAICGAQQADQLGRKLHVDHCHATNRVRGLLCKDCNTGIGYFKDSATALQRAADYLK